jgi:hypothetical protein
MTTELQPVNDASQVRNQVVKAVGVVELPAHFNLPRAGGANVICNATMFSSERACVDELLLVRL